MFVISLRIFILPFRFSGQNWATCMDWYFGQIWSSQKWISVRLAWIQSKRLTGTRFRMSLNDFMLPFGSPRQSSVNNVDLNIGRIWLSQISISVCLAWIQRKILTGTRFRMSLNDVMLPFGSPRQTSVNDADLNIGRIWSSQNFDLSMSRLDSAEDVRVNETQRVIKYI
jgi:hypothetical protein